MFLNIPYHGRCNYLLIAQQYSLKMNNTNTARQHAVILTLIRILVTTLILLLITTSITYFSSSSQKVEPARILQVPSDTVSPVLIQSIPAFRNPPFNVSRVIITGDNRDCLTVQISPNSLTQPDSEYAIQLNNRDAGTSRAEIKAIWTAVDIQSKKQLSLLTKATPAEITNHPVITAYWDGVSLSARSEDFGGAYTFSLLTINGLNERQTIDQQNQAQQTQYQQQLALITQQKRDIKIQQDSLNADYLQRLAERNTSTNRMLLIFVPIDAVLFVVTLTLVFLYYIKPRIGKTDEQDFTDSISWNSPPVGTDETLRDFHAKIERSKQQIQEQPSTTPEPSYNIDPGGRIPIPKYIRDEIIDRSENHCENPDCTIKYPVQIHHIDSNRTNNNKKNLIALCPICHNDATNGKLIPSQLRMWAKADYYRLKQKRGY